MRFQSVNQSINQSHHGPLRLLWCMRFCSFSSDSTIIPNVQPVYTQVLRGWITSQASTNITDNSELYCYFPSHLIPSGNTADWNTACCSDPVQIDDTVSSAYGRKYVFVMSMSSVIFVRLGLRLISKEDMACRSALPTSGRPHQRCPPLNDNDRLNV